MLYKSYFLLAVAVFSLGSLTAFAQTPPLPSAAPPAAPAVNLKAIVATVNGQPIYEAAVQRGLEQVPPAKREQARPEIVNYLVENALLDAYLQQLQIAVAPKEADKMMDKAKAEIKQGGKDWDIWLQNRQMTEAELKQVFIADLRWNTYAAAAATDKVLRELFDANKDMFDGTEVRARHILLSPPANDSAACAKAKLELLGFKKAILTSVQAGLDKLPADTTSIDRERKRKELLDKEFSEIAMKHSACPSRNVGGDVDYFPRAGSMVEAFADAAFALKEFEMSDVVQTQFGFHLILVTDRRGTRKDLKFEDAKIDVREVYCAKLREALVVQARQKFRVEIAPAVKP
jgi:peptidyl-prolyl cis-trans isomerase C